MTFCAPRPLVHDCIVVYRLFWWTSVSSANVLYRFRSCCDGGFCAAALLFWVRVNVVCGILCGGVPGRGKGDGHAADAGSLNCTEEQQRLQGEPCDAVHRAGGGGERDWKGTPCAAAHAGPCCGQRVHHGCVQGHVCRVRARALSPHREEEAMTVLFGTLGHAEASRSL